MNKKRDPEKVVREIRRKTRRKYSSEESQDRRPEFPLEISPSLKLLR